VPVNPDYVGRVYPPAGSHLVCREKVREFATAVGDQDPAYHDLDAARALGYPDLVAPPTFAFVLAFTLNREPIADPGLGVDYSRLVHGEQRFAYTRPIVAGDELVGTVTIEQVATKGPLEVVVTRTDLSTVDGEPVCQAWNTLIIRPPVPGAAS